MKIIETERLCLRSWKPSDAEPYFHINQNPRVIEFLRGGLSHEEVAAFIARMNSQAEMRGFTLWAAELKETGALMGFIGLHQIDWNAYFTPAVEVGWRLGSEYWGKGYATEGARAALEFGFTQVGLKEIVAITVPRNIRSRRVMEKIGMTQDMSGSFAHPLLEPNHPLAQHLLYRIAR